MKMKIRNSRAQADWLEGELVTPTGYGAAYWIEITREDGENEWCKSSDLHDVTFVEELNNKRYLYVNDEYPMPVILSGYVYTTQSGQVYYSAGKTIDEQRMNLLPTSHLIKITKREIKG